MSAQQRAIGYKYRSEALVLARFEAFSRAEFPGLDTPTQASVQAWIAAARRRGVKPATLQHLASPVRQLGRWLRSRGVQAYVLPAGSRSPGPPATSRTSAPTRSRPACSPRPTAAATAPRSRSATWSCRCCSAPSTPAACGLRASKARLLRPGDVDTGSGVLQIRDAKGGRDRQVPVSESLRVRLAGYDARLAGSPDRQWFFPGSADLPLTLGNIDKTSGGSSGRPASPTAAGAAARASTT